MRDSRTVFMLTALIALPLSAGSVRSDAAHAEVVHAAAPLAWGSSLKDAEARADQSGKVVLLELQSDYCKWCKVEDREAHQDSRFILLSDVFELCKLDGEKAGKPQIKEYRIGEYPGHVYVSGKGQVLDKETGYMDSDPFLARMINVVPDTVVDRLKAAPSDDAGSTARLIVIEAGRGLLDAAAALVPRLAHAGDSPDDRIALAAANHALGQAYLTAKQYAAAAPCFQQVALLATSRHEIDEAHSATRTIQRRLASR
ncbi:MAG: thioredoxin family protein [Chloroflexi bacterium]|nr:thioredoxin family protein [Chloroflexota bacterium]